MPSRGTPAGSRPRRGRRQRAVVLVDPGHHLVAEIGVIAAGAGRVEELAAAEGRPGVHPHDHAGWRLANREQLVGELGEVAAEGGAIAPHVELTGQPLDHVDGGVAPLRLVVVAGRHVHPERPLVRVAERVVAQRRALEDVLLIASGRLRAPRPHGRDCIEHAAKDRARPAQARPRPADGRSRTDEPAHSLDVVGGTSVGGGPVRGASFSCG